MVAIYVLKLVRGKYYVGLTRRNIDRVLDHLDSEGSVWTKKYPPDYKKPILSFQEGLKESDENRITLETMAKYGIENVRGGDWCRIKMSPTTIKKLEDKIKKLGKKTSKSKKTKATKSKKATRTKKFSKGYCIRCKESKKHDVERPYCLDCYSIWDRFGNPDYLEKYCHSCGKKFEASMAKPQCYPCWKK